ncbi:MAG: DUF3570 domain-containing protein [Steroidobacterales bacterium]
MQLKPKPGAVRRGLIAASCALLGASGARSQEPSNPSDDAEADGEQGNWVLDSAVAYYHENGRIQAIEPVVNFRGDDGEGHIGNFNLTFDSLSGSSPNGALPSNKPQTFASPSGTSLSATPHTYTTASGQIAVANAPIYTINPGQLPVDSNYRDQRLAIGGSWEMPWSRLARSTFGAKLSYEHDFLSVGVNASIARDFNQKNTTVSFGVNGEADALHPIGGAPVPGSDYTLFEKTGHKTKNGVGLMLGVTQVMSRAWLTEFNLSADRFTGYLNDPYKIISVLDGSGNTTGYLYEKRPDQRTRKSAYLENRLGWERASAGLSLRYMTDDWRVHSSTAQLRVRWWVSGRNQYWEPTIRWYRQTAADFYTPWIASSAGQTLSFASADTRLSAFHALTYGLKYAVKLDQELDRPASEFSVRFEYYQQTIDQRAAAPSALQGLDLYPGLQAILLQIGFSY